MSESKYIEITSVNNELIKDIAKLQLKKYRKESALVVLEGEKSVFGAIDEGLECKKIFTMKESLIDKISKETDAQIYIVNEKVMNKISEAKSAPDILAVVKEPHYSEKDFFNMKKILLVDSVKDAGNLGTIIRSAAAFGMEGILLFGDCVDVYCPKVIRSSAGNIFKLPIIRMDSDTRLLKELKNSHKIISSTVNSDNDAQSADYSVPFVFMLGSEASGLCNELLSISDEHVTLKMRNNVESLNLSVFAGIMLYIINSKY